MDYDIFPKYYLKIRENLKLILELKPKTYFNIFQNQNKINKNVN